MWRPQWIICDPHLMFKLTPLSNNFHNVLDIYFSQLFTQTAGTNEIAVKSQNAFNIILMSCSGHSSLDLSVKRLLSILWPRLKTSTLSYMVFVIEFKELWSQEFFTLLMHRPMCDDRFSFLVIILRLFLF